MKIILQHIKYFIILFSISSYGQLGQLDYGFGNNGSTKFVVTDQSTRGTNFIILSDNSVLVGVNSEISINGSTQNRGFYIYKIFENGQLDSSFGDNGNLYFSYGNNGSTFFHRMILLPNNKILLKCVVDGESKLIRFTQEGVLDATFGNNGIQDIIGGWNIALQSNGKIIVQSQFFDGSDNLYNFSRYNEDGALDTSFGNNGTIITDITNYRFDLCSSIIIQENDKIIAVGFSYDVGDDYHPVITRFDENGFLDNTFGNNGTVISSFNSTSQLGEFNEVKMLGNKIIVGGNYHYSGGTGGFGGIKPGVVKFNIDGSYDSTFGQDGKIILEPIYNANDHLRAIEVQPNGKILIGGGASHPYPQAQTNFYIAKLNTNGSLDTSFGQNGVFLTDFNNSQSSSNYVTDIQIHVNDGILAFGCTKDSNDEFRNAIICRLNNEFLSNSEFSKEPNFVIYPNPTFDFITVKSKVPISEIKIYNLFGQLILSKNYFKPKTVIINSLESIESGTYQLIVETVEQNFYSRKIIKI
tara:strand:+ start:2197 stop:3771 length:1575 start_codon:yes stop_codon:yes gene_type:complete